MFSVTKRLINANFVAHLVQLVNRLKFARLCGEGGALPSQLELFVIFQVTYDPKVQARTVTLGGDLFDPQGTATGGNRQCQSENKL